jgi:leucyl aminopeptidase
MKIEHLAANYTAVPCDILAYPIFEDEASDSPVLKALNDATRGLVGAVLSSGEFKPELHNTCRIHRPRGLKAERLLLVGAGKKAQFELSRLRDVAGTAIRCARLAACKAVVFANRGDHPDAKSAQAITEGALYANYEADLYKTRDREGRAVETLVMVTAEGVLPAKWAEGISRGRITGEATNFARTLANEPSNRLTPNHLAAQARDAAAKTGLIAQILEQEEMEKLGMNTLLAVSRGSEEPPKLIILKIEAQEKGKPPKGPTWAIVGKGVTFDSGGISIKPAERMEDMKADMAGGAAVLGAMTALAQLRPRQRVIGLIPAVENLPSGRATKPGDVVKSYLGKTVEIINTDAEGRLILADALAYAKMNLGATRLIDIATLTGACMVALGMINAGIMGTDQQTIDAIRKNCTFTGEKLWQLPIDDDYRKAIRSEIADMKNVGNRWGGAITAAKFLQEFVENTPWVHMDIAGVDLDHDGRPFASKGATGFGVRTFVELLS